MGWQNDDSKGNASNDLLQKQISDNEIELQAKKASLTKQRLAVTKSQDYPNFTGSGKNQPIFGHPTGT